MNNIFACRMRFAPGEVMGRIDVGRLVSSHFQQRRHDIHDPRHDDQSVHGGILHRPFHILEIAPASIRLEVEIFQPGSRAGGSGQMMFGDHLPHGPGPAVDHQPESLRIVFLQFYEVIATAQRSQLICAIASALFDQPIIAQGHGSQFFRQNLTLPLFEGRHMSVQKADELLSLLFRFHAFSAAIECNGGITTANIVPYRLGIDQTRCGYDRSIVNELSQMNVRHDGHAPCTLR
eukprot:TRINITY_DN14228_c0_g1_i1.p2 TRINITY_DN14228_c0_g1~~TRINITY_DN14228_c0_g1_i1.p2  ORF type:complete len:234 (-),score=-5.32 TRINITY_DN14228_c0_g1_i1:5-706(-)